MKSKLVLKILFVILVVLFIVGMFNNYAYADNFDLKGFGTPADNSIKSPFLSVMGAMVAVMRIVCTGIAIIMLMVIGMKYLAASPGERADLKKSAIQYVVGAVVLFGSAGILTLINTATKAIVPEG